MNQLSFISRPQSWDRRNCLLKFLILVSVAHTDLYATFKEVCMIIVLSIHLKTTKMRCHQLVQLGYAKKRSHLCNSLVKLGSEFKFNFLFYPPIGHSPQ